MTASHRPFGRTFAPAPSVVGSRTAIDRLRTGDVGGGGLLAVGNMRSYGDSCLNQDGIIADMRDMGRILSLDAKNGVVEAEGGAMLTDIIAAGAPFGLFPAVVPGTQFVTLGGAIANDVHGKNHHRRGTFGCHVLAIDLLRSDGMVHHCSATSEPELFAATIGGMGLTGIILKATLRLMPVASLDVAETATPFASLGAFFDMAEAADADNEYAVAWVDQMASGSQTGRGILFAGNHAEGGSRTARSAGGLLRVPVQPPLNVLNRPFLKLFNLAYRTAKSRARGATSGYQGFFFPLDGVRDWNRLYGPAGLYQHQSVVPEAAARSAIPAMFSAARAAGQGSFLTVLKRFGGLASPGLLSFPRPGYTLTLDFPNKGAATLRLLEELDRITLAAGGAVNPYKDGRMSAATFAASFPRWRQLEALRDPRFVSDFWRRTALRLDDGNHRAAA